MCSVFACFKDVCVMCSVFVRVPVLLRAPFIICSTTSSLQDLVRPLLDEFGLDANKVLLFGSCFTLELVLEVMCAY